MPKTITLVSLFFCYITLYGQQVTTDQKNSHSFYDTSCNIHENEHFKVYMGEKGGLKYHNKETNIIEDLITVDDAKTIGKEKRSLELMDVDCIATKISSFTLSPNKKQLAAFESVFYLNNSENELVAEQQEKLWFVDLDTRSKESVNIEPSLPGLFLFINNWSRLIEYSQNGYELVRRIKCGAFLIQKPFHPIAISNDKKVILGNYKDIYCVNANEVAKSFKKIHSFDEFRASIKSIQLNDSGNLVTITSEKTRSLKSLLSNPNDLAEIEKVTIELKDE